MSHPALIVIDVQQGLDDPSMGQRNNPECENNIAQLLEAWRESRQPVFHVQHHSVLPSSVLHPDKPGCAIKPEVAPAAGEPLLTKNVNSAFIGTPLETMLREKNISAVVLCGLTTDHCVSSSARMAANLGFKAVVVADATATFERTAPSGRHFSAEDMHEAELASLSGEFADVLTTEAALAWLDAQAF